MGKSAEVLKVDRNVEIAAGLLSQTQQELPDNLLTIYQAHNEQTIDQIEFKTDEPSIRVVYMSELLIGNQDSAVDFYEDTVNKLKDLPDDMKPQYAVLSGFMQGDFKYLQKSRRSTLVPELNSMNAQFKFARQMIKKMQDADINVIYNIGDDDRRIAEEYTIEVFRKMQDLAKSQENVNWSKIDKMNQHPAWNTHLQFQISKVVPFCLKAGRRLYTADEMAEKTNGKISEDEYFIHFAEHQSAKHGIKLARGYASWIKNTKAEIGQDFLITDDLDIHVKTAGKTYTDSIRHYMGFSPRPMYQNHMKNSTEPLAQMASNGHKTPDMFVTQNNHEEVGVDHQGSFVISTGGLIRASNFLKASGSRTDARGDISRRLNTTRRRTPEPSASIHERTDDGRHIVTFMNETLYEKSYSIPERMTIAELCDFQTGSITARPDILAKYLDYIRTRVIGERATALFFGGDMIHGRNYPHFPSESQMTGLMAMDSQEDFNIKLFEQSFKDVAKTELDALVKVLVQPGNHEWNSGTFKWHGYSFITYMRNVFEKMYARAGYSDEEIADRVKSHEATITKKGEYASGYTGIEYFGDMGVLIQHYLLERGGKGSGGDLPIYQAHHYATGGAELMENVDVFMAGHWHHPQYAMFGDKLALVGGSMAGISDYEIKRGYRPTIAGTLLHIGGGLPPQIEFVSEKTLHDHKITTGGFTDAVLKEQGYKTDRDFEPYKHGIFMPDLFAKSALQKKILQMGRNASQRSDKISVLR